MTNGGEPTLEEPKPKPTNGKKQRRWVNYIIAVLVVYAVISQIQLSKRNDQLDDISDFVDELKDEREQGPDPQLAQVFAAVFAIQNQVGEILQVLCTQFPDDPVCVQG